MVVFGGGNEGIVDELHVYNTCKYQSVASAHLRSEKLCKNLSKVKFLSRPRKTAETAQPGRKMAAFSLNCMSEMCVSVREFVSEHGNASFVSQPGPAAQCFVDTFRPFTHPKEEKKMIQILFFP
jgi:hypothetical protein